MKKQSNLSRLLSYAGHYKYLTYASWILSALSALTALIPFWYIFKIIQEVLETAPDFGSAKHMIHNGWMAVLSAVLALLIYIGALMCSHIAAFRIAANIRIEVMHHIAALPLGFTESFGSGRLRRTVNESSAATETYLAHQLPDKAGAIATPLGLLALLFLFDWRLGLMSIIPVLLGFLIMMSMTGSKMQHKMEEYQNALEDMSNEAVEYVRGIPVVKTFGQTVFSFKKFKDSIGRYEKWVVSYTKQLRLPMLFYTAAINSVFAFLTAAGLLFTRDGVTNDFLLNLLFYIIITPVISVTLTKIMFQSENAMIVDDALRRIDTVLDAEPLQETTAPKHPRDNSVDIQNVSYSYDGVKNALEHATLHIGAGETAAFVGPSGGGKTTLANILTRFFDPQSGKVLIGGTDVRDMAKEDLMNTVSFVFQNSRLIKASILENVRMGRPDASRAEVMEALRAAQCTDIIEKLPNGADTVIGANGVYLSGGEQQRIAIARVMLKNTPVIILDEATAFADPDNEARVQAAFAELTKGKTVVMIAHRLSTVVNADKIYVLKDGRICEQGTCRELQEENGLFHRMWKDYQTSVQWKVAKEA
ncbi:ABC transporter ATP-binding protein [[Clostridium] hylemonae]|uniref:ABC transporter, ATP-binding protein n=1 Tax=[Clostridium] hylemonae DSM 15053 TaxID=553973 RepID=C0BZY1_9FIRM|nr:ABC transporter ATP-binding protein [[Clostridium] hylemonae]EEG74709.1 ABC transporter, ATP-binding protein [[Clostridium] hylemonae DSM 15053]QEK18729.1 Iron import ATP-binding/permease protein IrtA [[Clostridium] hylemonae DSM 15053]